MEFFDLCSSEDDHEEDLNVSVNVFVMLCARSTVNTAEGSYLIIDVSAISYHILTLVIGCDIQLFHLVVNPPMYHIA